MTRSYAPTVENIDIGLAQCAELIERYPHKAEKLWLLFDRLEAEREKALGRQDRLAAAKARVRAQSADRTEARSSATARAARP